MAEAQHACGAFGADLVEHVANVISAGRFVAGGAGGAADPGAAGRLGGTCALGGVVAGTTGVVGAAFGGGDVGAVVVGEASDAGTARGVAVRSGGRGIAVGASQALDTGVALGITDAIGAVVVAGALDAGVGGCIANLVAGAVGCSEAFDALIHGGVATLAVAAVIVFTTLDAGAVDADVAAAAVFAPQAPHAHFGHLIAMRRRRAAFLTYCRAVGLIHIPRRPSVRDARVAVALGRVVGATFDAYAGGWFVLAVDVFCSTCAEQQEPSGNRVDKWSFHQNCFLS